MKMTREDAIKILEEFRFLLEGSMNQDKPAFDLAIESLSADEVVRCKDCIHWTEEKDEEDDILYGWCRAPFENDNLLVYGDDATRIFTAYDFFCKSGERREDGKEE